MDGGRRLAEPVTDGAPARPAAGTVPGPWRVPGRSHFNPRRTWLMRVLRRWFGPIHTWQVPRGMGFGATMTLVLVSVGYGTVRGGHLPEAMAEVRDFRDSLANLAGFRITSIALAGQIGRAHV